MSMDSGTNSHDVDLFALVSVIVRRRLTVLATLIVVTGLAVAVAFLMTPIYQSEVLLAPVRDDQGQQGLAAMAGQLGGLLPLAGLSGQSGNETKDQALAILRSRSFTERFIEENELLPVLFAERWDAEAERWAVESGVKAPTLFDGYRLFDEQIRTIREDSTTGLVTVTVEWKDRLLARDWARDLVDRLNNSMRDQAIKESQLKIEHLEEQVQSTSVLNLQEVMYSLMEQEISTIMAANVKEQFVFKILDPAAVSDPDKFVRPKRLLIILGGLMIGFVLGLMAALLVDFVSRYRKRDAIAA